MFVWPAYTANLVHWLSITKNVVTYLNTRGNGQKKLIWPGQILPLPPVFVVAGSLAPFLIYVDKQWSLNQSAVYLIICLCSFVFFPSPCFIFLGFFIFPSSTVNILNFTLSKLSDYTITVYLYLLLFSFFFNNLSISCIVSFCLLLFISLLNKLIFVFINNYCSHIFDYFLFSKFFFYSISGAILNRSLFLPISQRDSFE